MASNTRQDHSARPVRLATLSAEVLLHIYDLVPGDHDRISLIRCDRRLYTILSPELYRHDAKSGRRDALWWAPNHQDIRVAQLSLDAGADINVVSKVAGGYWITPLLEAIRTRCKTGSESLLFHYPEDGGYTEAVRKADGFLQFLLSGGANIHAKDSRGQTALHILCQKEQSP